MPRQKTPLRISLNSSTTDWVFAQTIYVNEITSTIFYYEISCINPNDVLENISHFIYDSVLHFSPFIYIIHPPKQLLLETLRHVMLWVITGIPQLRKSLLKFRFHDSATQGTKSRSLATINIDKPIPPSFTSRNWSFPVNWWIPVAPLRSTAFATSSQNFD